MKYSEIWTLKNSIACGAAEVVTPNTSGKLPNPEAEATIICAEKVFRGTPSDEGNCWYIDKSECPLRKKSILRP